jgi:hypothetical protein
MGGLVGSARSAIDDIATSVGISSRSFRYSPAKEDVALVELVLFGVLGVIAFRRASHLVVLHDRRGVGGRL